MRIALLVDNPYRDLPGLTMVAMELCQSGATCYLVPMNLQAIEAWTLAPDFVLLNFLRRWDSQEFARHLVNAGIGVGVLDTEGGVLLSLDDYAMTMAQDPTVRHRISCFCSWGHKLAEHAVKNRWYLDQQVVVTGNPRFDFYVDPWREAALQASPYADRFPKPLVLINGNFPLANPGFSTVERERHGLVQAFGFGEGDAIARQQGQQETMRRIVELANSLAARFPDVTFVYRPHPFEDVKGYEGLLNARRNLHLVKQGTVDGWILRASAVIQRSCSTAVEASLAGVPALSPVWIPTAGVMEAAEGVSLPCTSEHELVGQLEGILRRQSGIPSTVGATLPQVVKDWFCASDGQAHRRVASTLLACLNRHRRGASLTYCRKGAYDFYRVGRSWKARAASQVRSRLNLAPDWPFRRLRCSIAGKTWDQGEKFFGVEQVQSLVRVIEPIGRQTGNGSWRDIRVSKATPSDDYHFGYRQGRSIVLSAAEDVARMMTSA